MSKLEVVYTFGVSMAAASLIVTLSLIAWITVGDYRRTLIPDLSRRRAARHFPKYVRGHFDWIAFARGLAIIASGGFVAGIVLAVFGYGLAAIL